jgi:hypothetical protein
VHRYITSHLIRLFILIVAVAVIGADASVSAQNSNSRTTMPDNMTMESTNANANTNRSGGRRRGRRRSNTAMPAASASTGTETADLEMTAQVPVQTGRCDPMAQVQTDLSGTYTGTANYAEGGLTGEATLTINGNDFTITSGSSTQEGRVTAVTTCNYTGVTMMFGKPQVSAAKGDQPAPLPAVSLRARKVGSGLILESVGGETRQFSFSSAGASGGGGGGSADRPRARRGRRPTRPMPVGIKPPTAMEHAH